MRFFMVSEKHELELDSLETVNDKVLYWKALGFSVWAEVRAL